MRVVELVLLFAVPTLVGVVGPTRLAEAKGPDPAERGLDLFVHAAGNAVAGDNVAVDLIAYGFPSVTVAKPLAGATVNAAWDPESLGPGITTAPADVSVTTDALGRGRLDVPVPAGDARKLVLLVALRHGEHLRTRKIEIQRTARSYLLLRVPDANVVPGSQVPAWVTVMDARTGGPIAQTEVDVALLEGDVDRSTEHVTTDATGIARATLYVPVNATGTPALSLRGRLAGGSTVAPVQASVGLKLREETPATPRMTLKWKELHLKPGEVGHADVKVLDAADEPIAGHPVVYWVGPKGTSPPSSDAEWKKVGTRATTDGLGQVKAEAQAPRVVTASGSELTMVVRTEIEGQKLEQTSTIAVGQPVASAQLSLEGEALIPGIAQRGYLYVTDGEHGVAGDFVIEGDGLKAKVTTDAHGDAELTWTVPEDVGAARSVGPCAGGVAASVVVRQAKAIAALSRHPEPFELCVNVARERTSVLRTSVHVARIGDKIKASLVGSKKAAKGNAGSVIVTAPEGFGSAFWTSQAQPDEADIDLGNTTPGLHEVTLAVPRASKEAETTSSRVLVVPKVLPKLKAKLAGGRLAPGGVAEVDVALDDGHGAPIVGAVSAVVIDREGGGSVAGLERLDTRYWLCDQVGAPRERCDGFLEGDPTVETLRRERLTTTASKGAAPILDPAAHTKEALVKTFSDVLHSLEGAVFQSQTPESLKDVRRKENGRWVFNPELMTLVTAAMSEPPTTPGGEPFTLGDLLAVDGQVTFDNVARRVARLKLFNVLSAVRGYKHTEHIDQDEPMLNDPNALLRRLVRDGTLSQDALLDPWGGTIQFVKTAAPAVPFLTASRGFALHAPGPDGRMGTPDDVKDPFERVVTPNTPYATAMGEDEIVDAKWNMKVGDATVDAWQEMFARLTGTTLGHGAGTGAGQGFGSGHGRLGGSHTTKAPSLRMGSGIVTETARWTDPVRTDAQGKVRIRVPLGDYETTWRIALLARTDAAQSATAVVDAPAFLPLSARVDAGRKMTVGDEVSARIVVRNRTSAPKSVTLDVAAEGGLALAPNQPRVLSAEVPPNTVRSVFARVVASKEGTGKVLATLRSAGTDGDRTAQEMTIEPAGEIRVLTTSAALSSNQKTPSSATLTIAIPPGHELRGSARLVIESGYEDAILAALGTVEPEPNSSPEALADAIDVAARVEKLAESQGKTWLVTRTRKLAAIARSQLKELDSGPAGRAENAPIRTRIAIQRAALFAEEPGSKKASSRATPTKPADNASSPLCPKDAELEGAPLAFFLESEPAPSADGPLPCFTTLTGKADAKTPLDIARSIHALIDRPHRAPLATTLAQGLARATHASTALASTADAGPRHERVIVLTALARSTHLWSPKDPSRQRALIERILAHRDVRGGYGSSEATRDVVRTLVALADTKASGAHLTISDGDKKQVVDLRPNATAVVPLSAKARGVAIDATGGPVIARLERTVLRTFLGPPDTAVSPIAMSAEWPNDAKAGSTGVVHLTYKSALGRDVSVWTRMPLPPGVELAATVKDVKLRQGVVHIRTSTSDSTTIALPVRFTLPGKTIVPEAETRATSEEQPRALTPARSLVVR